MILPYLRRGQTWRVNLIGTQKTWIRSCILTVFKMQRWNFTVTSTATALVMAGVRRASTSGASRTIHSAPVAANPDDVPHCRRRCPLTKFNGGLRAFHRADEPSSWVASQEKRTLRRSYVSHFPGQVVERLTWFYRIPGGVRNDRVNHSKNVNATCIRTIFKIESWKLRFHKSITL